eukprot:NODE_181_length_13917_cov_0.838110.p10 type:complete len:212 gc:universal NODE_181_length_13917_cov_0.838110:1077-442(-)
MGFTCLIKRQVNKTIFDKLDTLKLYSKLEEAGFTSEQSDKFVQVIIETLNDTHNIILPEFVSKADQDKQIQLTKMDFAQLKTDIHQLQNNDFAVLKSENDRIVTELDNLRDKMREDMNRLQSSVKLDLNLEKGRMREDGSSLESKIRESEAKIDTEVSNLRTQLESIKLDIVRNVVGTVFGFGIICLLRWSRSCLFKVYNVINKTINKIRI